jgi:lysophospholipase L1-like esterase
VVLAHLWAGSVISRRARCLPDAVRQRRLHKTCEVEMLEVKKKLLINICLSLVSFSGTFILGYYLYNHFRKPHENFIFGSANDEYMFTLYNRNGEKISDIEGSLKLVIDPFTIYQNYPGQKTSKYSINSHGFRDTYNTHRPYTAIVLGGSAAFGFALDRNDQTFSSKISEYNEKYNVINAAVIGFLSGQELSQMIHYLDEFKPSLYIVFNGWNDIYDPHAFARTKLKENNKIVHAPIGYNNSFLGIEKRLSDYFQLTQKEKKLPIVKLTPVGDPLNETELFREILSKYVSNIVKMHSFANARGSRLLLVFQPELGNKRTRSSNESEVLKTWIEKYDYLDNKITERYKNFVSGAKKSLREQDISFIDINAERQFSENPQTLFFDVVHPNELGHDIIAKIINQTLLERF